MSELVASLAEAVYTDEDVFGEQAIGEIAVDGLVSDGQGNGFNSNT